MATATQKAGNHSIQDLQWEFFVKPEIERNAIQDFVKEVYENLHASRMRIVLNSMKKMLEFADSVPLAICYKDIDGIGFDALFVFDDGVFGKNWEKIYRVLGAVRELAFVHESMDFTWSCVSSDGLCLDMVQADYKFMITADGQASF